MSVNLSAQEADPEGSPQLKVSLSELVNSKPIADKYNCRKLSEKKRIKGIFA